MLNYSTVNVIYFMIINYKRPTVTNVIYAADDETRHNFCLIYALILNAVK
jgi:hypothetical protein